MEVNVLSTAGKDTGRKVDLVDTVFAVEPNDHAIYLDVKQHLANRRQGTHKAKERGEITGSTRKLKKQKGTGTARSGSIRNPLLRGGGRIFGPRPRDYSFKLNRKLKKVARKSALTYKLQKNELRVVEDFKLDSPKTKEYMKFLSGLNVLDKKSLLIIPAGDFNLYKSAKNLAKAKVLPIDEVNTYELLNAGEVIFAESSVELVIKNLNQEA